MNILQSRFVINQHFDLAVRFQGLPGARSLTPVEAFRSGAQALRAGDTKGGVSSLEYAAASGHPIAQWKLGRMYADGDGVKQPHASEAAEREWRADPGDGLRPLRATRRRWSG